MSVLDPARLHSSLRHPAVHAIGFLNEVMARYPDAISFAPGAPHPTFADDIDIAECVGRWLDHRAAVTGDRSRARRALHEYGPSRGLINDLVAEALHRDRGLDVAPEALVITVGAQEAMLLTLRVLFGSPGDRLAVAEPCFPGIVGASRLLDIDLVPVPDTSDGPDLDRLADACAAGRREGRPVRACYVAPDFANPSGSRMPVPARRQLLDLAQRYDLYLIEDNVYDFTAEPGTELPTLKGLDESGRVVHIGTFAKTCFPGARVGYVIADQPVRSETGNPRRLADDIAAVKALVTVNTSPIAQAVVGGILLANGGSLVAASRARMRLYRRNLARLGEALDRHLSGPGCQVEWNRPDGGFFVLMRLPVPADAALLEVSASKYRVLWTPMYPFYVDGGGERMLRLSCSYLDPDDIDTGVLRLAEFLAAEVAG